MSLRHEHIVDLVDAIEARLASLCPSLKSIDSSQATAYKDLARLVPQIQKLPAAIVVLGPIEGDEERSARGSRPRMVNLGILLVSEYDADLDEGAPAHWAVLDEVNEAFLPQAALSEKTGLPVAVLGDQDGSSRGTLLIPAGYRPMVEIVGRCAGVYNLLALDTVAAHAQDYVWYLDGGTPTSTFGYTVEGDSP